MTDEDKNLELIEEYINGFGWAVGTSDLVKTVVSANIRAFYHWSKNHLINERGDRLEAMIDRMSGTIVDLRMTLATVKEVYEQEDWTHYKTEQGVREINPIYEMICDALELPQERRHE